MPSVGERLRLEREQRDTTIEALAQATHIELRYLEALEQDEIEKLPGRAFGKLYIRAYAEVLGFAPEELIEAYEREQRGPPEARDEPDRTLRPVAAAIARWRESKLPARETAAPAPEPAVEPVAPIESIEPIEPVEPIEVIERVDLVEPELPRPRAPWRAALVLVALAIPGVWLVLSLVRPRSVPPRPEPVERAAAPVPQRAPEPSAAAPTAGHLTITEYGVGRRVVGRTLEGRGDLFARGQVVWFATRVLGGRPGESVRHVWLHEGQVVLSIELELGGPQWRTYSRTRLGQVGRWAVEAQDTQGQVLARATFTCE